jgi:glycerophosphoryl diester phosphodiesterase
MAKKFNKKKIFMRVIGGLAFICLFSWFTMTTYIQINYNKSSDYKEGIVTKYIAHRGLSSKYYQNTYNAYYWACMSSFFSGVECDIWRTKDGEWVCCHDDTPFIDKTILVSESDYDDIVDLPLDTSDRGEFVEITGDIYITPFTDYIKILKYSNKTPFVEIKYDYSQEIVAELINLIEETSNIYKYYFCSFEKDVIEKVLNEYSNAKVMLFSSSEINSYFYCKMGFNVGLNKTVLWENQSRIELAHENKSVIDVYTINTYEEALKYVNLGVDYITTDYVLVDY